MLKVLGKARADMYRAMIHNEELFILINVDEILWGYDEPIYGMLSLLGLVNVVQGFLGR